MRLAFIPDNSDTFFASQIMAHLNPPVGGTLVINTPAPFSLQNCTSSLPNLVPIVFSDGEKSRYFIHWELPQTISPLDRNLNLQFRGNVYENVYNAEIGNALNNNAAA